MEDNLDSKYLNIANNSIIYISSIIVAVLVFITSILGILFPNTIYPTEDLMVGYMPTDFINIVILLPILLLSIWHARKGSLLGILCLPGGLLYVVYIFTIYLIGTNFNLLFILYLLMVTISTYTLIALMSKINYYKINSNITEKIPSKIIGGLLISISIIFLIRQFVVMFDSHINEIPVDSTEIAAWIADFVIFGSVLIGGIFLLKGHPFGYASSAGLLLLICISFLGLIPFLIVQAIITSSPIDWVGIITVLVFGMIAIIPFYKYYFRGLREI
jgi:hypothetical protein